MITIGDAPPPAPPSWALDEPCTEGTIAALHAHTGVDVGAYRRPTIERRILNRMISLGEHSYVSYLLRLRDSRDEAFQLLDRVSIKVSAFYRNPGTFDILRTQVLPELSRRAGSRSLRVWSAGCGRGEEAWTLAMLLDELGVPGNVTATDIDPGALEYARRGAYPTVAAECLPDDMAGRYLTATADGSSVLVSPGLAGRVEFALHDLLAAACCTDAPFDLICCRNVLIYFQRDAQERAVALLRESLVDGGVLCLGEAEWPCGAETSRLSTIAAKARLFRAGAIDGASA